jgi:hypothetical protein
MKVIEIGRFKFVIQRSEERDRELRDGFVKAHDALGLRIVRNAFVVSNPDPVEDYEGSEDGIV